MLASRGTQVWIQAGRLQSLSSDPPVCAQGQQPQTHLSGPSRGKEGPREGTESHCFSASHCALRARIPCLQGLLSPLQCVYTFWVIAEEPTQAKIFVSGVVSGCCSSNPLFPQVLTQTYLSYRFLLLSLSFPPAPNRA